MEVAMQKWEYKRVIAHFLINHRVYDWVQYVYSNGTQVMENVDSAVFFDYLDTQGHEAWELINANSYNEGTHIETYFFKRPIE
jgi:hypothetical protein